MPLSPRLYSRIARRPAQASLVLLLSLPVLLLAMALAIFAAELVETRTQMRNATDAAALAGVQTFVDDRLLQAHPSMVPLIQPARGNAQQYAQFNLVFAKGLELEANNENAEDGDIVLGTLAFPRSKEFILPDLNNPDTARLRSINTMRVTGHRSQKRESPLFLHNGPLLALLPNDASAVSTATLDRDVIGFRPMGQQPMPLMPIALFSEPKTTPRHCWEFQVEKRRGGDRHKIRRDGPRPQVDKGGDGLHEMEPYLGQGGQGQNQSPQGQNKLNLELKNGKFACCLLHFGSDEIDSVTNQVLVGVSAANLNDLGGQLVLDANFQRMVPGTPWTPRSEKDAEQLQSALNQLKSTAEARIWPLFSSFDKETGMPLLSGFVAARVVQVPALKKEKGITFSVQPCMMSTANAVTLTDGTTGSADITSRRGGNAKLPNPYICKVRLVE